MDIRELLLLLISLLLGLVCIHWMRRLDRYEREPFGKLLLATVVGGGCAAALALGIFELIARLGFDDFESHLGALIFIGPVEEMAKLAGFFAIFGFISRDLNEPVDGIIYQACVALGFSLVENFLYAAVPAQAYLIFVRFLAGTPLHIGFSALMGLCVYLWYRNRRAWHLVLSAYLCASLSHSLYDLVVFQHISVLFSGVALLLMYAFTRNLFIYALAVSPQRVSLAQAIAVTPQVETTHGLACRYCDDTAAKPTWIVGGAVLRHCEYCDHFNTSRQGLFRLFYHYAGLLKSSAGRLLGPSDLGGAFETLYQGNHICIQSGKAFFRLAELDAALERLNYRMKHQMRSQWYLPYNLFRLDRTGEAIDYLKMVRDAKTAFWRRLLFPIALRRPYRPPEAGPRWNWSAFLFPEIWCPAHQLWGTLPVILAIYALSLYLASIAGFPLPPALGGAALLIRAAVGRWGARIHYRRHGKWP
jgi:RsiW-degrading membrane proteinase PrsW (M82 family)